MIVIFSGYNQRAVIAFIRTLKKNRIEDYVIIASSEDDSILKTAYRDKVYYVRKKKQLDSQEIFGVLTELGSNCEDMLIAPSTEALNRFLLENRRELEAIGCIIPLVDSALYEKISDKESFYELCRSRGLKVPSIIEGCNDTWPMPFVAKPKRYTASDGKQYAPVIVYDEEQKKRFLNNYNCDDFDIQEFVTGRSLYLFYYFPKDGSPLRFSQENICQQPGGKSILLAVPSDIHNLSIADEYERLFVGEGYRGMVMVEVRQSGQDYYMIEANPRFWGPSQLCVDSGVNYFEAFLKDYGITIEDAGAYNADAKYMWLSGFNGEPETDNECVWHGDGFEMYLKNKQAFLAYDIYSREDTKDV